MTTPCRSDPIESPYDFAQRVAGLVTSRWTTADHRRVADVIAERDRRVRAEALASVAHWVAGMRAEVTGAEAHRAWLAAGAKGMHVPFHGDFASVPVSGLSRIAWWLREIESALSSGDSDAKL